MSSFFPLELLNVVDKKYLLSNYSCRASTKNTLFFIIITKCIFFVYVYFRIQQPHRVSSNKATTKHTPDMRKTDEFSMRNNK